MKTRMFAGVAVILLSIAASRLPSLAIHPLVISLGVLVGITCLVHAKHLWMIYAFWGGLAAGIAGFLASWNWDGTEPLVVIFGAGSAGLVFLADKVHREYKVLSKLKVWVPTRQKVGSLDGWKSGFRAFKIGSMDVWKFGMARLREAYDFAIHSLGRNARAEGS